MKRAAIVAVVAIGAALAASPTMAAWDDDYGPGYAAPRAPGYLAPRGPGYGSEYYRGQPCVTDEGGGRLMPCDYGGADGGQ
jgi:hypothetical protein